MQQPPLLENLTPPRWLKKHGKAHWRRVAPALRKCGVLTVLDVASLAMYCAAIEDFKHLETRISRHKKAIPFALAEYRLTLLQMIRDQGEKFIVCADSRTAIYKSLPGEIKIGLRELNRKDRLSETAN